MGRGLSLSVLCVVYKKALAESLTLMGLCRLPEELRRSIELIVRDNSPASRLSAEELGRAGFGRVVVEHDGRNLPLGTVYRTFAERAQGPVVLFFDDDSDVREDYFREVLDALKGGADPDARVVCLPRIYDQAGRLFSPSRFKVFRGEHLADLTPGRYQGLNAIMSGVATTTHHLARLGPRAFCEHTRLYGVDTMFMCAHAAAGGDTIACAAQVTHRLSRDRHVSVRDTVRRSALEAEGLFWTVAHHRRGWLWLAPVYLAYFMARRTFGAVLKARAR